MINSDWTNNITCWEDSLMLCKYEHAMSMADDIVNYNITVREVAKNYCVGKTTVSRYMDKYVKFLDNDLYWEVKKKLNFHKTHSRNWRR